MTTDNTFGIFNSPPSFPVYNMTDKMKHAEQMRRMDEELKQIEQMRERLEFRPTAERSPEKMFENNSSFRLMQSILNTMQQDAAKEGNHFLVKQCGMSNDGFNQHGEKVLRLKYVISINMIDVYESSSQVNISMKGIPSGELLMKQSVDQLMEKVLMHMIRTGVTTMCAPSTSITMETEL